MNCWSTWVDGLSELNNALLNYLNIAQDIKRETWVLTEEGKKYAAEGSPEVQLFLAVPAEGSISKDELQVIVAFFICDLCIMSQCMIINEPL